MSITVVDDVVIVVLRLSLLRPLSCFFFGHIGHFMCFGIEICAISNFAKCNTLFFLYCINSYLTDSFQLFIIQNCLVEIYKILTDRLQDRLQDRFTATRETSEGNT